MCGVMDVGVPSAKLLFVRLICGTFIYASVM
jgi:hypothetical protein